MTAEAGIDLILISEDFLNHDYGSRIDILSEAIYDVFAPIEVVGFTYQQMNLTIPAVDDYYSKSSNVSQVSEKN